MGRPTIHLRVTYLASTATLLLFLGHRAVFARTSASAAVSTPPLTGGLDRILVALGVLLVLAQATERVVVVLRKFLTRMGKDWAKPSAEEAPAGSREKADRALVINAFLAVPAGLFVAVLCGVDVIHLAVTGDVALIWQLGEWKGWQLPQHLVGLLLTGLIASMGSAFLHDLIAIVTATKDARRKAVPTPQPAEDPRELLGDDHPSIYDIDRESVGLPLDVLGRYASDVAEQLRAQGIQGIVSVGPAYKERSGRRTRVRGLTVSVNAKVDSAGIQIPEYFELQHEGSAVLVPLDIREVGTPEPMSSLRPGSPIIGGNNVRGTTCCLMKRPQSDGPIWLLGCQHVLGDVGDSVRLASGPVIGAVHASSSGYDAAVAQLRDEHLPNVNVSNVTQPGWKPDALLPLSATGIRDRRLYMFGREDGHHSLEEGRMVSLDSRAYIGNGITLRHAFQIEDIDVAGGDSGALGVVQEGQRTLAAGMLCGADTSKRTAWFVPIITAKTACKLYDECLI